MSNLEDLKSLARSASNISEMSHADRIRLFAWYLHEHRGVDRFTAKDIGACYDDLNLERPANLSRAIEALTEAKPKHLIKNTTGYSLVRSKRDELDQRFGGRESLVKVTRLLVELPAKVKNVAESVYLLETLICLRHGAFRASIVMCWNLAYSHFCEWILTVHAVQFNAQWPVRYAENHKKSKIKSVVTLSDFSELKESEVIEIARSAGLISGNIHKVLTEKLTRRNMAAHPSTVKISQLQAEECIDDLVNNIVLQLT